MDSSRWQQIQTLFHKAADLPRSRQHEFLKSACGDDSELMDKIAGMLEEDSKGSASLLDSDVAHVAHALFDKSRKPALADFGPYCVRELLGEGGMGVVYLAERADLGSLVAIKVLRDAWLSPSRRDRFASEQRTLAQLNHPSIARLYDANTFTDGTPWFAMEYVEGVPLTEYCSSRQLSIHHRLKLFRSVCEAVQYAHSQAVIHRDLKPSNIMVKPDATIRLLDFGIAKQIESFDAPDQTRTGLRLMTPAYAAPEQIRGERVGIQSDVYSLGVILYELLTGRLPFDFSSATSREAETIVLEREPEKPSSTAPRRAPDGKASWDDLDVLCLTAMHKDVGRRYRSVEALIRDVDHYLAGQPLEARPDTYGYRLGKFVSRNRRSVSGAAFAVSAGIGLIAFFTARLARARNAALVEAARTERIQRFMTNLFQGGDEAAGPPDRLQVVTLLDRGVQEARSLDNEPEVQAELYQTLGSIYQKLGNIDQAESLLQAALHQRQRLFGPDGPEVAESIIALGMLKVDQAQFEEAERLVREGLETNRRHLPSSHPAIAKTLDLLGRVLQERGEYVKAIEVLEQAVGLRSAYGASPDLASSLFDLASTHFYAGHFEISNSLNQQVLEMHRELNGDRHPLVAEDLINLGAIQYEWGRYEEAEKFYRQSLRIVEGWYGKDHHRTASNLTMLGRALIRQERYDEAVELLRQALVIQERVFGEVHPRVASALNELGTIAQQRGNLDEAEACFRKMAETYKAVYGDRHYLMGIAISNLGGVYLNRGDNVRSEQFFRDAVKIHTEALSPDHLNTGIARLKLGRALLRQSRFSEAETHILAGYEILMKQTSPSVSWLQAARADLVSLYEAVAQPEKARTFMAQ